MKILFKLFNIAMGLLILVAVLGASVFSGLMALEKYWTMQPLNKVAIYNTPPPDYLLIKGERWYVDSAKDLDKKTSRYAYTDCAQRIIVYDEGLTNPVLRESVWHEISHAELCDKHLTVYANWQIAVDGEEHDVIYPLSMAQISFMHDNPLFMKWMENW